jgi:hypothetical protein
MAEVTFDRELIDRLLGLLGDPGGDLVFCYPFYENTLGAGADVQDISSHGIHSVNQVAVDNVPVIRGNLLSYRLNGTDEFLETPDNVLLTPISAGVDVAFSVGCAFKLDALNAANKHLISKWDDQTPLAEWRLYLDATERPTLELMDNSVGATGNIGREDATAVAIDEWYILIGTYDGAGGEADIPGSINLYGWTTGEWMGAIDDTTINGAGAYVDMENTATPMMIGAADTAAGPVAAEWFDGEIMLPFMTRRELSVNDALRVARQMVRLMEL